MKIDFDSHTPGFKSSTKAKAPCLGAHAMRATSAGDDTTRILSKDQPDISKI